MRHNVVVFNAVRQFNIGKYKMRTCKQISVAAAAAFCLSAATAGPVVLTTESSVL